jgi:shikimate dehydrogenase
MKDNLFSLLGNGKLLNLEKTEYYAAIIGESPSKGARSPVLWNASFRDLNVSCMMHPMDVAKEKLKDVIDALRMDHRYIGGAVAVPYKQDLLPLLDRIEEEAETIGAINCIYRDGDKLVGTNTDGAGALESLKGIMDNNTLESKSILILGLGGAGQAVATYMAKSAGASGKVILANRTSSSAGKLAEKLKRYCSVETSEFPVSTEILKEADILINCTSVGFESIRTVKQGAFTLHPYSPLGPVDDSICVVPGDRLRQRYIEKAKDGIIQNIDGNLRAFKYLQQKTIVFDIIYQPLKTTLLHIAECHGMPILNGLAMNLEQAVIAFQKATRSNNICSASDKTVRKSMLNVD